MLHEEDFGHVLQQLSLFFSSDLHKVKLGIQLKILIHIVNEKQVKIKDTITIISSLNASQMLLVSEVLRLVKLILTAPAPNAVSKWKIVLNVAHIQNLPAINFDSRTSKFLFNSCYL